MLEEYRTNYRRLVDCYQNIQIEVVHYFTPSQGPHGEHRPATKEYFIYRSNGGKFFRMDGSRLAPEEEKPAGRALVTLVRPEGYLTARREDKDRTSVPEEWSSNRLNGISSLSRYRFHTAPFSFDVRPIEHFAFRLPSYLKSFTLEKAEVQQEDGEETVSLTWRAVGKDSPASFSWRFVFYRNRAWALKEYSVGPADRQESSGRATVERARFEYEGLHDGVPLLKRAEYWSEILSDSRRGDQRVYEVRSIVPGPVRESEFDLDALGIKMGASDPTGSLGPCWV